jgi:hypothetical protein
MTNIRRLILPAIAAAALLCAAPVAASAATTAPAAQSHAITQTTPKVIPLQAQGCSGDACIQLGTPSGGKAALHGCAWKSAFTGHIQLSGPASQLPKNSPTQRWASTSHYCTGGDQYYGVTITATVGQYCSTSWNGGNYDGTACESIK